MLSFFLTHKFSRMHNSYNNKTLTRRAELGIYISEGMYLTFSLKDHLVNTRFPSKRTKLFNKLQNIKENLPKYK